MITIDDLHYIKNFSKISVSKICEENNINRQNLLNNKSTKRNAKIVKEALENKIFSLYVNNDLKEELLKQRNELMNKKFNMPDNEELFAINYTLKIIDDILGAEENEK